LKQLLQARLEKSRSRSRKHAERRLVYIYTEEKGLQPIEREPWRIKHREKTTPIYVDGEAENILVELDHGEYLLEARFNRNNRGKVKGLISVYNYKGKLVYRAKYIDGELRRSTGNPIYAWLVRLLAQTLHIPVRKTMLGDEKHA
jgi:hypothetical protein